jgi:hypothetical protein
MGSAVCCQGREQNFEQMLSQEDYYTDLLSVKMPKSTIKNSEKIRLKRNQKKLQKKKLKHIQSSKTRRTSISFLKAEV